MIASAAKGAGTKIMEALAPVSRTASATVLKTGRPSMVVSALPRGHPSDHFGPVGHGLAGVEHSLIAGNSLTDHPGIFIHQDAHPHLPLS